MARALRSGDGPEPGARPEVLMNASRTFLHRNGARLLACALVLAALGGPAREGFAQASTDVQRAIEVTQGVIDRASTQLSCPPGEQSLGCAYLAQAVTLQASARGSYGSGFYRDALALTQRARDRAYSALRVGAE